MLLKYYESKNYLKQIGKLLGPLDKYSFLVHAVFIKYLMLGFSDS